MSDDDKTWPEWTDVLGQTYRAGDRVAIATISGRSPQMVIGTVVRINRVDSHGEEIVTHHSRWEIVDGERKAYYYNTPSCTVRVQPEIDARGFYRTRGMWIDEKWVNDATDPKQVTYQIPANIIKLNQQT